MPGDLWLPLIGSFAFDIDAENSKYHLICSLATQLGLEVLASTVFNYRDRHKGYLNIIVQLHKPSCDKAKRLPSVILIWLLYNLAMPL
jgi:hypothetical protein